MDICNSTKQLVRIEFDQKIRNHLLHLQVLLHDSIDCVRNIIHDYIQIHLVRFVTISVEGLPHFYAIRMMEHFKDCQLPILVSLVLEYFLDGNCFTRFCDGSLEHHAEGTIADNLLCVVGETLLYIVKRPS